MTLKQFVESTWFKLLARCAAVVGTIVAGAAATYFFALGGRVDLVEITQRERTVLVDNTLGRVEDKVDGAVSDISEIKSDISTTREDVATMKGILQEMQRRSIAARYGHPFIYSLPYELTEPVDILSTQ